MDESSISFDGKNLSIHARLTTNNVVLLRSIPEFSSYRPKDSTYIARPTQKNILYLRAVLSDAVWSDEALSVADKIAGHARRVELGDLEPDVDTSDLGYDFGEAVPREYQKVAFALARDREFFGLLMDMRTGKTFVGVHWNCFLFERGEIDRVLVLCPKSVKYVWKEQIAEHAPKRTKHDVLVHSSERGARGFTDLQNWVRYKPAGTLQWLVVNGEAMSSPRIAREVEAFVRGGRCKIDIDESTAIKNPAAQRTRRIMQLRQLAVRRAVYTGTPVPNGVIDLFAQMYWLDPNIIGCRTITEFQSRFCDVFGYHLRPKRGAMEELRDLILPHTYRVTQKRAFRNMPAKQYTVVPVDMGPEQDRIYHEMRDNLYAELEGQTISAPIILTKITRLLQITGGFVKPDGEEEMVRPIPGSNPKLAALHELIEQARGEKVVIWARFTHEIRTITQSLELLYGAGAAASFYGAIPDRERTRIRTDFQDPDSKLRFFVGQPGAGGMGISLWRASTMIYFSNSYDYLHREQSESRIVIDRDEPVSLGYYDLTCRGTWDERVLQALAAKQDVSSIVTGDNLRNLL